MAAYVEKRLERGIYRVCRIDPDREQPLARRMQEFALALFRHRRVKPGVEDQGAALADDRPDEIIERHRPIMRVATVKILARPALVMGIAHGVDLVDVGGHRVTNELSLRGAQRRSNLVSRVHRPEIASLRSQ